MTDKHSNYYKTTQLLLKKVWERDISLTVKALDKTELDKHSKVILLGVLVRKYTMRTHDRTAILGDYMARHGITGRRYDIHNIAAEVENLSKEDYNKAIQLMTNMLASTHSELTRKTMGLLNSLEWDKLSIDEINGLSYNKSVIRQLTELLGDFNSKCTLCGQEKSIKLFNATKSYCSECSDKFTGDNNSLKAGNIKMRAVSQAALSIKK